MSAPLGLSGSAGRSLARRLRRIGWRVDAPVEGFRVSKGNRLKEGELARAYEWGRQLAAGSDRRPARPDATGRWARTPRFEESDDDARN
jgi:hypothetical protein